MKHRIVALATLVLLAACAEAPAPTQSGVSLANAPFANLTLQTYTSGSQVTAWGPIYQTYGANTWAAEACTLRPAISLTDSRWGTAHPAFSFGLSAHPWQNQLWNADWINAWNNINSTGGPGYPGFAVNPKGHNWSKYESQVTGNGTFVLSLLADNCSWVYLDGTLVGYQNTSPATLQYGVTLNGTHTLTFMIFDGGGSAGGMYRLETTSNPPPPLAVEDDTPVDNTPPSITPNVAGTLSGGWYTSNVTVTWTVTDAESAVTSSTGCGTSDVTTDTRGITFTCSATSAGGTDRKSVTIKRDATAPVIAFGGNASSYTVDQQVNITCSATDAMSGLASSSCPGASGDAYSLGVGSHTLNASATDNAGNRSAASTSYTVSVTSESICALVKSWVDKAGVAHAMCQQLKNGAYNAFINHVQAQSDKSVTAAHAAILIDLAGRL